jgi:hypothetical protein
MNGRPLGRIGILTGIAIRPRATFEGLREVKRGHWWLVFLITVAAVILYTAISASVMSRATQGFIQSSGVGAGEASVGVPQVTRTASVLMTVVVPLVSGVITILAGYAFRSLIVFGTSLILGGTATFKQIFRMAAWTTLPLALRRIVQTVAVASTQGRIVSGLSGALTVVEANQLPFLNTLLGQIDIYVVWSMILLGIGTAITAKLSKGKSLVAVLAYLALAVVGLLIFSLASNALGSLTGVRLLPGVGGPRF